MLHSTARYTMCVLLLLQILAMVLFLIGKTAVLFLSFHIIQTVVLPRQAQDKHRGMNHQKQVSFLQVAQTASRSGWDSSFMALVLAVSGQCLGCL